MEFHDKWFDERLEQVKNSEAGIDTLFKAGTEFPEYVGEPQTSEEIEEQRELEEKMREYKKELLGNIYGTCNLYQSVNRWCDNIIELMKNCFYILPRLPLLFHSLLYCEWLSHVCPDKKWYRDHVTHAAKVTMLGDWFLWDDEGPRIINLVVKQIKHNCDINKWLVEKANPSQPLGNWQDEELQKTIKLSWRIAGLFHDIGYPIQRHNEIGAIMTTGYTKVLYSFGVGSDEVLSQISNSLLVHLNGDERIMERVKKGEHGALGAVHLLISSKGLDIGRNARLALELAANAIFNHHRLDKLFSIEPVSQNYLNNVDNDKIDILRREFEKNGILLSRNITISCPEEDGIRWRTNHSGELIYEDIVRWRITDENNQTYVVREEKSREGEYKLNIYEDYNFSFRDDPISYLLLVADNCQEWGRLLLTPEKNKEDYIKLHRYIISDKTEISSTCNPTEWQVIFHFKESEISQLNKIPPEISPQKWNEAIFRNDKEKLHSQILTQVNGEFPRISYNLKRI